ncbi:hypothetical protein EMIT0P265_50207 [Pseudomonas zeae]
MGLWAGSAIAGCRAAKLLDTPYDNRVTQFYRLLQVFCAVSQDCATQRQESTNGGWRAALNL